MGKKMISLYNEYYAIDSEKCPNNLPYTKLENIKEENIEK